MLSLFQRRRRHRRPAERDLLRLPPAAARGEIRHYLAAAAVIGDEVSYIREWVAFHYVVGFDALHLYLNRTERFEATLAELRDFVDAGVVTITQWSDFLDPGGRPPSFVKNYANAHAIALLRGSTRWLALIDADEFLFSPAHERVPDALKSLERFPAVAVFWRNFASGGRTAKPDDLVIGSYFEAAGEGCVLHRQYKTIVDPNRVTGVFNAHRFLTDEDRIVAYTESGVALGNWRYDSNTHESRFLRINHYYVKSDAEFRDRIATGWGAKDPRVVTRKERNRALIEAVTVSDHSIERFLQKTREVIALGPIRRACEPLLLAASE